MNWIPSKTLLLIESNEDLRWIVSEWFVAEGFQILTAADELEGMQLAKQHLPDLILCEVHFPAINGLKVLQRLKRGSATATIPVILWTTDIRLHSKTALQLGASAFLLKPIGLWELQQVFNQVLWQRHAKQPYTPYTIKHQRGQLMPIPS